MNDISFVIDNIELYTEKVLVELEIPLLFICKDKSNKRYTVLCVDSDEERYLIAQSKVYDIVDMIQNTITMKELFMKSRNGKAWMVTAGETIKDDTAFAIDINIVSREDLPADGTYFEVYNADIHDYVDLLLNRVPKSENEELTIRFNAKFVEDFQKLSEAVKAIQELRETEGFDGGEGFTQIIYNSQHKI